MRKGLIGLLAVLIVGSAAASAAAAASLPVIYNGGYGFAHASPTASPPGCNNCSCKPTAAHPRPVILVHGTFEDMADNWQALSPLLVNNGYCVFALNYGSYDGSGAFGIYGTGTDRELRRAALELRRPRAGRDRREPGRHRRPFAGRDDASLLPEVPQRRGEGAHAGRTRPVESRNDARRPVHARELLPRRQRDTRRLSRCAEQQAGSPFMTKLNAGGDTVPGVDYTVIESRNDEVVTPYKSAFLTGPNVTNITLQDQCPLDQGEHLSMAYDHIADADVLTALDPQHPVTPACTPVAPVLGG